MRTITILYPGAMGSAVARLLAARGWEVYSYVEGRSPQTHASAVASGVKQSDTLDEAVAAAELVMSLVPPHAALSTAEAFAASAQELSVRPLFLDANSIGPALMWEVCGVVERAGAPCVDGAFVGSDRMLGERTTLYLSGSESGRIREAVSGAFRVEVLGRDIGLASAFKLTFAGFNKGLVCLFLQVAAAAGRIGLQAELLDRLQEFYPGTIETVERLLPTYPRHCHRRIEEMTELERWLADEGLEGAMVSASKLVLERFAELNLADEDARDLDTLIEACRSRSFLSTE